MSISYQEVSRTTPRRGGVDITVTFTDSETGETQTKTCYFARPNPFSASVTARFNYNAGRFEFKVNPLNVLDFDGDDFQPALKKMVQYIRNNPDCTKTQLKTAAETQFPNLFWNVGVLVDRIKAVLRKRFGGVPTFDQFKAYVINHKFSGVDG